MLHESAMNNSLQALLHNDSHYCLFSLCIQSYNFLSLSAKYIEFVTISIYLYLSVLQFFLKKL